MEGGLVAHSKKDRPLKFRFMDDLDRSGLPGPQKDAVRRIAMHAKPDGTGSHPSLDQIARELGKKSARAIQDALNGRRDRNWEPVIGKWIVRVSVGRKGKASEYRLMDEDERRRAAEAKASEQSRSTGTDDRVSQHQSEGQPEPPVPRCKPDRAVTLPSNQEGGGKSFDAKVDQLVAGLLLGEDPRADPWYQAGDPAVRRIVDESLRRYEALPSRMKV